MYEPTYSGQIKIVNSMNEIGFKCVRVSIRVSFRFRFRVKLGLRLGLGLGLELGLGFGLGLGCRCVDMSQCLFVNVSICQ